MSERDQQIVFRDGRKNKLWLLDFCQTAGDSSHIFAVDCFG